MSCEPAYSLNSAAGAIWVKTLEKSLHRVIRLYRTICNQWSEVEPEASVSHDHLKDGV
ncbi:hypothetical protein [Methanosarcina sp. WH1]|uniref:hypothetical protein n=1 Tax=Methanosarcina sp. WH1 TaxID=1434102 RepID=UPI0018CD20BA|nr:hypothetical protein [Methanosarcina sp. WH1]